jgi:transcriptional regulator with XRE-family HTH domain
MGISQEKAAEMLGISRSALKQIETGVLPLSEEIATRMLIISGARIPPGLCRETAAPLAWNRKPYNANSLNQWKKAFSSKLNKLPENIVLDLQFLIKIAERKGCLIPFMWAVQTALRELVSDFRVWDRDAFKKGEIDKRTLSRLFGNFTARLTGNGIAWEDAIEAVEVPASIPQDNFMQRLFSRLKKSSESKKRRP